MRKSLVVAAMVLVQLGTAAPAAVDKPRITEDHIPYGAERKDQMAGYSRRHYGFRRWRLRSPRVLVLHFTAGSSYEGARSHFSSNQPARGELPGVCAHYIVDKDGTIYEVVPTTIRCRHAIGLNYTSIGIEFVQEAGEGSHWADRQILERTRQIRPGLKLAAWLKQKFDIKMRHVIGHAMANDNAHFKDLEGWRNDHTDWLWRDVKVFRRRLRRLL